MDFTNFGKEYNIAQVSIKLAEGSYEMITLHQFLKKNAGERTELAMKRKVQFFDFSGEPIPLLDALRSITDLIRKLRDEGNLLSAMH